jgi:hypothetical protein
MAGRSYHRLIFLILTFFIVHLQARSQAIVIDENAPAREYPYISLVFNRIFNSSELDSFYQKLFLLKKQKRGTVSIVHVGDSHVQSEFYPAVVRKGLTDFFGGPASLPGLMQGAKAGRSMIVNSWAISNSKYDSSGVYYHTMGVNGARFETFLKSDNFWQSLPRLQADLYIISLGTNDAQSEFKEKDFHSRVFQMVKKLKNISPSAAILFTTAADSFKGGRPNRQLWNLNVSLFTYCSNNHFPLWDLYRTTNGFGSAYHWIKSGLMDPDGIHYTSRGYEIHGQLLFNAIAKGYNNYIGAYK